MKFRWNSVQVTLFNQTNSIYKFRLYIGGYFVQAPMRLSLNEGLSDIR